VWFDHLLTIAQYTACDIILLGQVFYYRGRNGLAPPAAVEEPQEDSPLLPSEEASRSDKKLVTQTVVRYVAALVFVFAVGVIAWWISSSINHNGHEAPTKPPPQEGGRAWAVQILGWSSAVFYVCAAQIPAKRTEC